MKSLKIINRIIKWLVPIVFLGVGIFCILIINTKPRESFDGLILGVVLMVNAISILFNYFVNFINIEKASLGFIIGLIDLAFSFVFLFGGLDIKTLCLLWGILEIVTGALNIAVVIHHLKNNPFNIISMILGISQIVFGTLLSIKLFEGIVGHLIFISIFFFINTVLMTAKLIIQSKRK